MQIVKDGLNLSHRKTDSDGKQVVVGVEEDAKLFCRTNAPWKKCLWKPPRNGVRQVGTHNISQARSMKMFKNDVTQVGEKGLHFCDTMYDFFHSQGQ